MKLWTIHPIDVYEKLLDKKVLRNSIKYASPDTNRGYNWMINQMERRIGNRPVDCYPLWAWYQCISKKRAKPDLRESAHLKRGTKGVRIEIEKDEKSVLLSDFELWHYPLLFRGYIADSDNDITKYKKLLKQNGIHCCEFDDLPEDPIGLEEYLKLRKSSPFEFDDFPKEIQNKMSSSWNKIFDMDFHAKDIALPKDEKSIQATFWELKVEDIIKVDYFTAR
jgi:hypothetical protein